MLELGKKTWQPAEVGDLFLLIMPNRRRRLMRVTRIDGADFSSVIASIDDAMRVDLSSLPTVKYGVEHL